MAPKDTIGTDYYVGSQPDAGRPDLSLGYKTTFIISFACLSRVPDLIGLYIYSFSRVNHTSVLFIKTGVSSLFVLPSSVVFPVHVLGTICKCLVLFIKKVYPILVSQRVFQNTIHKMDPRLE
ncbi:hypothetical protein BS47DRAFT_404520 [Hydnum rufescens UP504]|uniref:Uncharacterized protein n=1 Tax=Hydnum rufescens UP504 TaxID=1448309 RepID=A0A9P6BB12_9AGAM|nr:hypothetical protein BS47DRAFT_404520 [Hydnum rufescens UP504]